MGEKTGIAWSDATWNPQRVFRLGWNPEVVVLEKRSCENVITALVLIAMRVSSIGARARVGASWFVR